VGFDQLAIEWLPQSSCLGYGERSMDGDISVLSFFSLKKFIGGKRFRSSKRLAFLRKVLKARGRGSSEDDRAIFDKNAMPIDRKIHHMGYRVSSKSGEKIEA